MRRAALALALLAAALPARAVGPANSSWPQAFGSWTHASSTTVTALTRPRLAWSVGVGGGSSSDRLGPSLDASGNLYILMPSTAVSFDSTGAQRWIADLSGPSVGDSRAQPALTDDGQVIFSTRAVLSTNRWALSLNANTGGLVWSGTQIGDTSPNGVTSPAIIPGGNIYLTAHRPDDGCSTGCNASLSIITSTGGIHTGLPRAGLNLSNLDHTGALSPNGATYYIVDDTDLFAVGADTAGFVWSTPASGAAGLSTADDGTVLAVAPGKVMAFNPADGSSKWTHNLGLSYWQYPAAASGNLVFVSSKGQTTDGDTYLVALDLATGNTVWSVDVTTALFQGSPCMTGMCTAVDGTVGPITVAGSSVLIGVDNVQLGTTTISAAASFAASNGAVQWVAPLTNGEGGHQIIPTTNRLYEYDGGNLLAFDPSPATQFSVSATSLELVPGSSVTLTAFVKDAGNAPVSNMGVVFQIASGQASPMGWVAMTDANGEAAVSITSSSLNSSVIDSTISVVATCADFPRVTTKIHIEGEALDHFTVQVPTYTPIGIPFQTKVFARNAYDNGLPNYPGNSGPVTVSLSPFLAGTSGNVAGTGSLGTTVVGIVGGTGTVTSETYNKIENIDIKATLTSPFIIGLSTDIAVLGPDSFNVIIPTGIPAGSNFSVDIYALQGGTTVQGYTDTLSLSPVVWNATGTAGSGTLSVTNVNMAASGHATISNETYNAGQGIRLRVTDSALGVTSYSSSMTVTQPALTIDHYAFKTPASVTVGNSFSMEIDAQDVTNTGVSYSLNRSINIQAVLNGTNVAGSGSLGDSAVTLLAGTTYGIVAPQTYNKIENIQLKATDQDGKTGTSSAISVTGPTQFVVTMPSAALAGNNFQLVVQAEDASNSLVLGYDGTVSISAVQAANTSLAGAGILNVTNLTLSGGAGSTAFESYTKAEGIRFRVADTGIGVSTITASSMTVLPGPPNSLAFTANPISTIAGVPVALQSTVSDLYGNLITGTTVTFSLSNGSGTVSTTYPGVSNVTSTNAVTNASGLAQAFFSSTNTASSQADLLYASDSGLTAATTVYNAVLIGAAGGTVVDFSSPTVQAAVPANAYAFNVRFSINAGSELAASDVALATAAMAAQANTFVSSFTAKIAAVQDSSPSTSAGAASSLVTLQFPVNVSGGNVQVGSLHAQNLLVPLSVMRVFKLNQATNIFEMVLDGTNLPNAGNNSVQAQVKDPNGIYALGAPPYTPVSSTSSGTVTTTLSSGATAQVSVPFGAFATPTAIQVSVPQASAVPAVPSGMTALGSAVTVQTIDLQQPQQPVTIQLGYTAAQAAAVDPSRLRLARYDASTGWVELQSSVDTAGKQVTGTTNHFSIFQIVAVAPANDLSTGYVFPNPFRPALGHANIKFTQLPAGAEVRVYSISGRLLQELTADNAGQILSWTGADKNGRPLPSGVYLAVVAANGDKKTLKFAVQR